jgi:hypothetical protein
MSIFLISAHWFNPSRSISGSISATWFPLLLDTGIDLRLSKLIMATTATWYANQLMSIKVDPNQLDSGISKVLEVLV